MHIVVGVPVFDLKLPVEVVKSIMAEQIIAMGVGDEMEFCFLPGCSHPAMGRNQIVKRFLDSKADRLVFLDADVSFEPGSLVKIAHHKADFVGGAYRFKMNPESYPVGWKNQSEMWANSEGLLEVDWLATGFLSLSRKVFDTIQKSNPNKMSHHMGNDFYCFFEMPFFDGRLYGEDSFFSKIWTDLGGKIYLDPELSLTHWDYNTPFHGHVGNWLRSRIKEAS
jgi:hypothetical protein